MSYERARNLCSFLAALAVYDSMETQKQLEREARAFLRSIDSEGEKLTFKALATLALAG